MKPEELTNKMWNAQQSWYNERLIKLGGTRLKVSIRNNAYSEQSYARVARFDGTKWLPLVGIAHPLWPDDAQKVCYVTRKIRSSEFDALVSALLAEALMVLEVQ